MMINFRNNFLSNIILKLLIDIQQGSGVQNYLLAKNDLYIQRTRWATNPNSKFKFSLTSWPIQDYEVLKTLKEFWDLHTTFLHCNITT